MPNCARMNTRLTYIYPDNRDVVNTVQSSFAYNAAISIKLDVAPVPTSLKKDHKDVRCT